MPNALPAVHDLTLPPKKGRVEHGFERREYVLAARETIIRASYDLKVAVHVV